MRKTKLKANTYFFLKKIVQKYQNAKSIAKRLNAGLKKKKKKKKKKKVALKACKNKLLNMLNTQEPIKGNKTIKGIRA